MEFTDAIRNLGIIAHVDAGKTTLTERILHDTGALRYCGAVDEGTTVSDYLQQERERGISIISAAVTCFWRGVEIDIVDTPGHIDFTAEVERGLRVMDSVVAVICGVHGVQAQSEMVWRRARKYDLPALCYINKLDREGASYSGVLAQLRQLIAPAKALPITVSAGDGALVDLLAGTALPGIGGALSQEDLELAIASGMESLVEELAECGDDQMMACWLDGRLPEREELIGALRRAVLSGKGVPVYGGSAASDIGVRQLLDGIVELLPSPSERLSSPAGKRTFNVSATALRKSDGSGEYPVMTVVRVIRTPWPGDYAVVRLYSGNLRPGCVVENSNRGTSFKVGGIWRLQAADLSPLEQAISGEIVGISAQGELPELFAGDTLVEAGGPKIRLARMKFPEPVVSLVVAGISAEDRAALPGALKELAAGDPTLRCRIDEELGQCRLSGIGELQLQVTLERLESDYGIRTRTGQLQIAYRTTISRRVVHESEFRKQFPGAPEINARVKIELSPLHRGGGVTIDHPFTDGSKLPQECIDALMAAVQEIVAGGGPTGHPLADTRITVQEASTTSAEASEPAFLSAARSALIEAIQQAGAVVLEPVMRLEVSAPQSQIGSVITDVTGRRGKVLALDTLATGSARMVANVPAAQLVSYATELRAITGGRAEFTAEPLCYQEM